MSTCNFTTIIDENLCIGDSLPILNSNFDSLDTTLCNLSSISNALNLNLTNNSNLFVSNIFNELNLLSTKTTTGPQELTPAYLVAQAVTYQSNNASGTFITPNVIPNTANFILLRSDYISSYYIISVYVNGLLVPVSTYEIDGIGNSAYLTLPISNLYTYSINAHSILSRGVPNVNTTTNIRVIGYY